MMTYADTIDYLFSRLPMFSKIGARAIKADLTNTIKLCTALQDPQKKFKSIHIAGTNGKGSVSHMLAAVFQQAGYKTGLYTSPHLYDFRERIRINGEMIAEEAVVKFTQQLMPLIEELSPSFFEITVAMAFHHFANEKVDIAIIETGLGGRLDSTNIIIPELSIITNIGMDHVDILGDTPQKIAAEKAGIIKNEVPVVIGEALPETKPVFIEKAQLMNAFIFFAEEEIALVKNELSGLHRNITVAKDGEEFFYELDLPGKYQAKNVRTLLCACSILEKNGWTINNEIAGALRQVKLLTGFGGRWDIVAAAPKVVLDVAHNADGMRQVLQQLKEEKYQQLHFVLGMVKDKDISAVLKILPATAQYYFTQAHIPRAMSVNDLKSLAESYRLSGVIYEDVNEAVTAALLKASSNDLILVAGSVFLVAEVRLPLQRSENTLKSLAAQLGNPSGENGIKVAENMAETNIAMTKSAIQMMQIQAGEQIAEIGHGNAAHVELIFEEQLTVHYTGLEISALMQQEAERLNAKWIALKKAAFLLYDGHTLPFKDAALDKIFSVNTIYFWQDPDAFLQEIKRVLREAGTFTICFAQRSFMEQLPFTRYGFKLYAADDVHVLAQQNGFCVNSSAEGKDVVISKSGDVVERTYTVMELKKKLSLN